MSHPVGEHGSSSRFGSPQPGDCGLGALFRQRWRPREFRATLRSGALSRDAKADRFTVALSVTYLGGEPSPKAESIPLISVIIQSLLLSMVIL